MPNTDPDLQAFFTQKPNNVKRWYTVEIYHPVLGTLRYIRDFVARDLLIETGAPRNSGEIVEFLPLGLNWDLPAQTSDGVISIPVTFSDVGINVRESLKQLNEWAIFDGVEIIPRLYLSNIDEPKRFFYLDVTNIQFPRTDVNISASDENPANQRTARTYDFNDFPGLAEI